MKLTNTIPVIFHNLKGYDSHLLLPELGKFNKKISIIPNNMQTYMSFSVGNKTSSFDKKSEQTGGKGIYESTGSSTALDSWRLVLVN